MNGSIYRYMEKIKGIGTDPWGSLYIYIYILEKEK